MATPLEFAQALLDRLGLPRSQNNLVSLVAFTGIEGTFPAGNNPFNSTLSMPGATNRTGVGVKDYPDWATGVEATARTLQNGLYGSILNALSNSVSPQEFLQVLSDSRWCSNPSTVESRSPECGSEEAKGVPCYCNYAKYNAQALYNEWANKSGGGALATASNLVSTLRAHPVATAFFGTALALGVVYYFRPEWVRPLFQPLKPVTTPIRRLFAFENPIRRRRPRRRHARSAY